MTEGKILITMLPISSQDIIKYVRNLKINNYHGIFSRDNLPEKSHAIECNILNLNIPLSEGCHRVAFHTNTVKVV